MSGLGCYAPLAAFAITDCSLGHIAAQIGVSEGRLSGEIFDGDTLTRAELSRLRRWLWSAKRIYQFEAFGVAVVVRLDVLTPAWWSHLDRQLSRSIDRRGGAE